MKKFEKIMGAFEKTATKLDRLAESNAGKAEVINEEIMKLEEKSATLAGEATSAVLMASKLRDFMEV